MRRYAVILAALAFAFACRVAGQAIVVLVSPPFLPPMEEWYSGLLPYPILLSSQIAILIFQFEQSRELWMGRGPLTRKRRALGVFLQWFSAVYALAMVARLFLTTGDRIPIVFHWVLAGYLYVLSRYHRESEAPARVPAPH